MQSKHLFGVLFLFLSAICFMNCSDDDKSDYHLELSKSSCEVTQGRSVAINLTAHEHTTLVIKKPELIEAVFTWELGSHKAIIEIRGKQIGETDIIITDHETGESATIKVKVTEYPMPLLGVKQPKGNIFDMLDFYIYNKNSQSGIINDLSAVCDSIVWTVDGLKGSFRVFEYGEGSNWAGSHLTMSWGHCFKYPGEYKTYLTAWKDNKTIYRHQLDVSITDNKDFLGYNWSDITKESQAWTGYEDVLRSSPDLHTTYGLKDNVPYIEVRILFSTIAQSYSALNEYFRNLYSAPTYGDRTDKMWQRYNELFSEHKPDAYPDAIWVTERANIALLLMDESTDYPGYVVYAEPNSKNFSTPKN